MSEDIEAILDEEIAQIEANKQTSCYTCIGIKSDPAIAEYISRGLARGMTQRQVADVVLRRRGYELKLDSLGNHIRNKHDAR